jgi:hypothetical protein
MSAGMRRLSDLGLAMVVVLFAAPGALGGWPQRQPRELLLTLAMILPLLGRRRWPTLVFGFIAVVAMVQWLTGGQPMGSDLALLVAFYTVAANEPLRSTMFWSAARDAHIPLGASRRRISDR